MIETHAHMDFPEFDADRDTAIRRAQDAGVHTIINIGTDFDSCERILALAEQHERLFAVLGVHPHDAKIWNGDRAADRLKRLADHPKVVGIGEIGLDYFRNHSPREQQKAVFIEQIAIARELKLPIVIHNRAAFDDLFGILLKESAWEVGGVMHCFSEGVEEAVKTIDLGFHLSVNGILTYNNSTMAVVAQKSRLDRIILETDCPFLAPHPHRGKRNEPSYIPIIAARLAELRARPVEEVVAATDENAMRLFRLPPVRTSD